jgi:hypothetical protein
LCFFALHLLRIPPCNALVSENNKRIWVTIT